MAAENFKVKKGLEVGTAITATSSGVNVTGIVTATQFVGDGSGLTGVTGSGSGVVVKDEGSAVGTAGTINFVGSGVAATLSQGTATVTVNAGGLDNVVEDLTPQLGGNLDLNGKFVNGTGGANITGVVTATTLKGNGDFVDIDVDGRADLDDLVVAGVTTSNQINISSSAPRITFSDTNENPDFYIEVNTSQFLIQDVTNNAPRFRIQSTGIVDIFGNANFDSGIDVTGGPITAAGNLDVDGRTDLDDLVVSGVGTFSTRIDTNGVELGTNTTTFAAKFADNAVANFGTDNDLKISHDNSNALIRNSTGKMVVVGVVSATSGAVVTGVVTATTFSGSGASLTNLPSAQLTGALPALDGSALTNVTGSGSGIIVRHDGSVVGTASSINFSTNLDVSAISAGIVTVTASGGSATTINNNSDNRLITGSGTANTLEAESGLTYDGTYLNHIGSGFKQLKIDTSTSNSASLLLKNQQGNFTVNTINNSGNRNFTIYDGTAGVTRFSINQGGTVGITSGLTVSGDITGNGNIVGDNSTNISGIASVTATSFHGSGVSLTSLNADNLGSGTIPNGRFPTTLPAVGGGALTDLNATALTTGTVPTGRFGTSNISPSSIAVTSSRILGRVSGSAGSGEELTAAQVRTLLNVADGATAGITEVSQDTTPDLGGNLNLNSKDITGTGNVNITGIVTTTNLDVSVAYTLGASSSNHYTFTGGEFTSATNDPDLYLERGRRYLFVNPVASSHPFEIRKPTSGSANATAYSTGVTGNGGSGNVIFDVPLTAPSHLYYQCTSHSSMGGNIYITGREDVNVQLSHRNLIINGNMEIAQRGGSVITVPNDTPTFTVDRFGFDERTGGSAQLRQSTDVPAGQGFYNSLYANIVSTDSSISGNENAKIRYVVEDVDVRHLQWGTANAKPLTVSFWVKSNVAGQTLCFNVSNWPTNTRTFIAEYTLPSGTANSWQKHVINIPGDTTGTWTHITLQWVLAASSDYQKSGTGWAAWSGSGGLEIATSNQYNWFGDANHFYLTGVQLERGNVSTPFEHKSFAEELARCQRYCVQYNSNNSNRDYILPAKVSDGDDAYTAWQPPVAPRTTVPTISVSNTSHICLAYGDGHEVTPVNFGTRDNTAANPYSPIVFLNFDTNTSVLTAGDMVFLAFTTNTSGGYIRFEWEL